MTRRGHPEVRPSVAEETATRAHPYEGRGGKEREGYGMAAEKRRHLPAADAEGA